MNDSFDNLLALTENACPVCGGHAVETSTGATYEGKSITLLTTHHQADCPEAARVIAEQGVSDYPDEE